ncbi:MAG TPA: cupredoxin family copper-binding protein [Candidatus Acidoferrales bacterium]
MKSYIRNIVVCAVLLGVVASSAMIRGVSIARAAENKDAAVTVTVDNFSFTPKEITVAAGTTITWVNHDDVPHTVVSTDKKFRSKALDTDDQFSFTFTDSGTYAYFCSVHPMMTGKIIVK